MTDHRQATNPAHGCGAGMLDDELGHTVPRLDTRPVAVLNRARTLSALSVSHKPGNGFFRGGRCESDCGFQQCMSMGSTDVCNEEREKSAARELLHISQLRITPRGKADSCSGVLPSPIKLDSPLAAEAVGLRLSFKEMISLIGPGWMVAMAYVDPGNLEGDLSAGSLRSPTDPLMGYRLLWVLLWSTAVGFFLQRLAIKLALATGSDLATLVRHHFGPVFSTVLWVFTEMCLVGADVQAVIGSAIGLKLLFGVPFSVGILITLIDTFLFLLVDCCGTRRLEGCFAFLISLMAGCFFVNMITSKPDFFAVIKGLAVPVVPEGTLAFTVALIGSVIMPHNLFLQSAVVHSRCIDRSDKSRMAGAIHVYTLEAGALLFVTLLVNVAVVIAFANPAISPPDGSRLDLYNAHTALQSAIGGNSAWIWALGLLAAGQCSTMACTYAGQFVMEGLLGLRLKRLWLRVFVTRLTSIVPLLGLIYLSKGTVEMIANGVNILQAFNLPFTLVLLLKFSSSPALMGPFILSRFSRFVAVVSGCFLTAANLGLMINQLGLSKLTVVFLVGYLVFLGCLWQWPNELGNWIPIAHTQSLLPQVQPPTQCPGGTFAYSWGTEPPYPGSNVASCVAS